MPALATLPLRTADSWLFSRRSELRLATAISALAALIGVQLAFFPWSELSELPASLFRPVPFLSFLGGMPPAGVIIAAQVIGVVAALLATFGKRRPLTFALAWLPYLFLAGLRASRGKIQHNDLVLIIGAVPFLLAPTTQWVTTASTRVSRRWGWPINTALAFMAMAYFFTGFRKVTTAGIAWVTSDNMRWILYSAAEAKSPFPDVARFIADRPWLSELSAATILLFELGFPLLLIHRHTRRLLVVMGFAFHGGTWVTLGLDYWKYAIVMAILLVDWTGPVTRLRTARWVRLLARRFNPSPGSA